MTKLQSSARSTATWSPGDIVEDPEFELGTWAGLPMWTCIRCKTSTTEESELSSHVCKVQRFVSEQADEDDGE